MPLAPGRAGVPGEGRGQAAAGIDPAIVLCAGFHEVSAAAPGHETIASALVLGMAARAAGGTDKSVCYGSLAADEQEHGALYGAGIARLGIAPERLLMIVAAREKDLLWTLEEAAASGAFGAIIGALGAKERVYGFAESRRLKLRAGARSTPLFMIRHWSAGGSTAANGRWRVSALPSRAEGGHATFKLPGPARLKLQLERMSSFPPQQWEMEFDAARGFHMAPLLEDGPDRGAGKGRHQAA